jgi:putative endonuclease
MKTYYIYILASKRKGTLYIGITSNISRRIWEHEEGLAEGFTKKYGVKRLVYVEQTGDVRTALEREKQLKKWNRAWKIRLVEENNPKWKDISERL